MNGVQEYDSHYCERMGVWASVVLLAQTLAAYRRQIVVSMVQDWANTYRGSYLGLIWALVMPVVPMTAYMVIGAMGIFKGSPTYPAGVYISAGITIWMLFAETITISINSLFGMSHSLANAQTPLIVPIISKYSMLFSDTLVRLAALVIWLLIAGAPFRWTLLLCPLLFLPVVAFSMGVGLILAVFNTVAPDINQVNGMVMRYAIFFSYAIFPLPDHRWVRIFSFVNIPGIFIANIRSVLVLGKLPQPGLFAAACVVGLVVFALGVRTFFRLEPHIIEKL